MSHQEKVSQICQSVTGKNVEDRRIEALRSAGYEVEYYGIKGNFGQACTTRELNENEVLVQIKYAKGGRVKSGNHVNFCTIYKVAAK